MPRGVVDSQDVDDGTDVDIAHFPAERSLPRPGPPTRGRGKRERPARGAGHTEPQRKGPARVSHFDHDGIPALWALADREPEQREATAIDVFEQVVLDRMLDCCVR